MFRNHRYVTAGMMTSLPKITTLIPDLFDPPQAEVGLEAEA